MNYLDEEDKKSKHVLVAGSIGCGETLFLSQIVAIKLGELELKRKPYRVIVVTDSQNENCHLMKKLKSKHFKFIKSEINEKRKRNNEEPVEVTFTTLKQLMIKFNIVANTFQDKDNMQSLILKGKLLTKEGWLSYKNSPTVRNALHASTDYDIPEHINESELLKDLNHQSDYKGAVTLEWLEKELCQFFEPKGKDDLIMILRNFRQSWLFNCFWKEYWSKNAPKDTCCSLLSFKLDRLLAKIQEEEPGKKTIFMLNLFTLDNGKADFPKDGSIALRWKPPDYKKMHLFISIEPTSLQNFEIFTGDRNPIIYGDVKTFILGKNYRTCDKINSLLSEDFNFEANPSLTQVFNVPPLEGQKPLWISTDTFANDKANFMPLLSETTKMFVHNVIWTCHPPSDYERCRSFCDNGWQYIDINHIQNLEAACLIIFGMPTKESLSIKSKLNRIFSRARSCLVLLTEENFMRYYNLLSLSSLNLKKDL